MKKYSGIVEFVDLGVGEYHLRTPDKSFRLVLADPTNVELLDHLAAVSKTGAEQTLTCSNGTADDVMVTGGGDTTILFVYGQGE